MRKKAEKIFLAMVKARGIANVVSGKKLISKISDASKKKFGASFGPMSICKEMTSGEFDPYLVQVVKGLS